MSIRAMIVPAALLLLVMPVLASPVRRLPDGVHPGRCTLIVKGQSRISGRCFYHIDKGGDFHIDGPHQVFDGIDYPSAHSMAERRSKDYWADVFRDAGKWNGYGNSDIEAVHGDGVWLGLRRSGACYIGEAVRICLWRR